jgi:D-alanyl-D-alanine carboxypeptidase
MRRPTVLTVATAVALALPAGGVAAAQAQDQASPTATDQQAQPNPDQQELANQVRQAAEKAARQRQAAAHSRSADGAPSDRETRTALDQAARQVIADGGIGLAARVESPDFDWRGSAGARELDGRPPAQPQDRFRVASITKTMVAALVMQEVEAGTFTLQTPVNELVPGLFPEQPAVTVEHLLSHRSGAQTSTDALVASRMDDVNSWPEFFEAVGQDYTSEEYLSVANALPWLFEPGSDMNYANAGYVALGVVLEEVTGEDLEDLLEDRVFDPAGLRHTSYPDDPGTPGPFLVGAAWTGTEAQDGLGWVSLERFDPDVFGASGAVVSTTKDLNTFTEALIEGDLVDPALVEDMLTPRTVGNGVLPDYGLGVFRVPDPCTAPGEPQEWLYGHDGGTYGGSALALTSADGTRQLSFGLTGRDLTQPVPPDNVSQLLVPMLLATC